MSLWSKATVSQGIEGSYLLPYRTAWRRAPRREQLLYATLHFLTPPPFPHHFSFFSCLRSKFSLLLQGSECKWNEWPFAGLILLKAQRFVWRMSAHADVSGWKARAPRVEPELVPCQISHLYPPRLECPSSPQPWMREKLNWEQFVCKWRYCITDDRAATQRFLQLALWKMRNRDTIYPRCVASQCLCSCNAS